MENQRIFDFIRKHLEAGHSETAIRRYFLAKGASPDRVDALFTQYQQPVASQQKSKPLKRKLLPYERRLRKRIIRRWIVAASLVLVVVVLAGANYAYHKHHRPAAPAPVVKALTDTQKLQLDISTIASAVSQYASANHALPTSTSVSPGRGLQLCGAICDSSTSDVFTLNSYDPSQVKFAAYTPNLTVPSAAAIYLVPAAKCGGPNTIGGPNTKPRSMVLLYAFATGSELSQHCLTL